MGNVAAVQNGMDCCQAAEGVSCDDDEEKKTHQTRQRTETLQRKPSSLCGDVPWTDCMDDRRGESNRNRNRGSQNGPGLPPDGTRRPLAAVQGNSYGTQRHSNAYPTESWDKNGNYTLSQSLGADAMKNAPDPRNNSQIRVSGGFREPEAVGQMVGASPQQIQLAEKMQKLVTLRERGHITEGEFFVAKGRILQGLEAGTYLGAFPLVNLDRENGNKLQRDAFEWKERAERFADDLEPDRMHVHSPQARRANPAGFGYNEGHVSQTAYRVSEFPVSDPPRSPQAMRSNPAVFNAYNEAKNAGGDARVDPRVSSGVTNAPEYRRQEWEKEVSRVSATDYRVSEFPVSDPPRSRAAIPPPAKFTPAELESMKSAQPRGSPPAKVIYPKLGTVSGAYSSPSLAPAGIPSPGSQDDPQKARTALAQAAREVDEQKRLLQREVLKDQQGLDGNAEAGQFEGARSNDPVEERLRRFLASSRDQSTRNSPMPSPREMGRSIIREMDLVGREINPTLPPHAKSNETQFVI